MITHFNLVNLFRLLQIGPCRIGTLWLGISCNVSSKAHSSVFLLTVAFLVTSVHVTTMNLVKCSSQIIIGNTDLPCCNCVLFFATTVMSIVVHSDPYAENAAS